MSGTDLINLANQVSSEFDSNRSTALPSVNDWNPPYCGELDIRIATNGVWYYMGTPIGRRPLVRLFASILRHDLDGCYYLVTPVEKVKIQVDDAPLIAVDLSVESIEREAGQAQQELTFVTNMEDRVTASKQFPIEVHYENQDSEPRPYVLIRDRLKALIHRNVFYQLVNIADTKSMPGGGEGMYVSSMGEAFELGRL